MKKRKAAICCIIIALLCQNLVSEAKADNIIGSCETAISAVQASTGYGSTVAETELGNLLADAVRAESGCDMAVVCGGHIFRSIIWGDITEEKLADAVDQSAEVLAVEVTPAQLYVLLETALSQVVLDEQERIDGEKSASFFYPQISGFSMRYDASAPPGFRMIGVTYNDRKLDSEDGDTHLKLAVSKEYMELMSGNWMMETRGTGWEASIGHCLNSYITKEGHITAPDIDRVMVLGVYMSLFERLKAGYFLPYVILVLLLAVLPRQRHRLRNLDGSLSKRYKDYER